MQNLNSVLVTAGGILLLIYALLHLSFWWLFKWNEELAKLTTDNSNIVNMLNIGCAALLLMLGIVLLTFRLQILQSSLGQVILLVVGIFFLIRLICEFSFPGGNLLFGIILLASSAVYLIPAISSMSNRPADELEHHIIGLETEALESWNHGNPDQYLSLYDKEISYFDPFTEHRLDGYNSLEELYNSLRGQVNVDKYQILEPRVQHNENMAVLTYNLISGEGEKAEKWNCTEVYQKRSSRWMIIHTHWSFLGIGNQTVQP